MAALGDAAERTWPTIQIATLLGWSDFVFASAAESESLILP